MINKNHVLKKYPTAICLKDEPCHQKDIPCFIIVAEEDGGVVWLGSSSESPSDAWSDAKINIEGL